MNVVIGNQTRTITMRFRGSALVMDGGSGVDFVITSNSGKERIFSALGVSAQERTNLNLGQVITFYSTETAWSNLWRK